MTRYEADSDANGRVWLTPDTGATVYSPAIETSRRFALGESMHLTPRVRLVRSEVLMSGFGDTAGRGSRLKRCGPSATSVLSLKPRMRGMAASARLR